MAVDEPVQVVGPVGQRLTLEALPPPSTRRWTPLRKAEIVAAVRGGLLSVEQACNRYSLAIDELISWQVALHRNGVAGLRVTRAQHYRELYEHSGRC